MRTVTCKLASEPGSHRVIAETNHRQVVVYYNPEDSDHYAATQKAQSVADVRHGAQILGTERLVKGKWRVVAVGSDAPSV